jgi:hypothetical protein
MEQSIDEQLIREKRLEREILILTQTVQLLGSLKNALSVKRICERTLFECERVRDGKK